MADGSPFMAGVERATRVPPCLSTNLRLLPATVSAVSKTTHNMSDTEPSGAATPAAETANTPSPPPNPVKTPSAFSNSRGSGLARGKRPVSPPAPAAPAAPAADYKPTAVSILTAPSEYKNPFAPPVPAATPVAAGSPEAAAPAPAPAPAAAVPVPEIPETPAAPAVEAPPGKVEAAPSLPLEAESKPELNILPPEAPKRVEHSWESDSFRTAARQAASEPIRSAEAPPAGPGPRRDDRRGDRPVFRPERERRDDRYAGPRATSGPAGRAPGAEFAPRETPPPVPTEAPKKSGSWFGWVKKLFGGSTTEKSEAEGGTPGQREFGHEGQHRRRRRRGGRGRHFNGDQHGPRDGQAGGQPPGEQRGFGGEFRHHGRRRRRHHGGGDYRGGGRPEGGPPAGS